MFDETNPFAQPSPLPFHAPPFDKIKDSDYQPVIEEGMRRELAEVIHSGSCAAFGPRRRSSLCMLPYYAV